SLLPVQRLDARLLGCDVARLHGLTVRPVRLAPACRVGIQRLSFAIRDSRPVQRALIGCARRRIGRGEKLYFFLGQRRISIVLWTYARVASLMMPSRRSKSAFSRAASSR